MPITDRTSDDMDVYFGVGIGVWTAITLDDLHIALRNMRD